MANCKMVMKNKNLKCWPIFVADTKIIHGYNFRAPLNKRLTFYLNAFRSFKSPGKKFRNQCVKKSYFFNKACQFSIF